MRSTITLACILKNEAENLPRFLKSVEGCFDEIHLTDTGSTDESLAIINEHIDFGYPIKLFHFDWVNDFSKARNASFQHVTTDYVMWMDLDDVLSDKEKFIDWRDSIMHLGEFWMNTYHYAMIDGMPKCSFARERVVKTSLEFQWKYFVHEGMMPISKHKKDIVMQYATTWTVNHMRTGEDLKKDRSRNLEIFQKHTEMDSRMRYYYGKELFENQKPLEAFSVLMHAVSSPDLELHDRIMGIQYACLSAMMLNQPEKGIQLAHQGLQLAPQRAEFFIAIADCYIKQGRMQEALPFYEAAANCQFQKGLVSGAIFQHEESYTQYPLNQIARIYTQGGHFDKAQLYLLKSKHFGPHPDIDAIEKSIEDFKSKLGKKVKGPRKEHGDIIISCAPQGLYEWDSDVYRERGIGGSETACVEMSEWLSKLTDRKVLVFNSRKERKECGNVSYVPCPELPMYLAENKPDLHVAWRHATQFNDDPMYLWCHDLGIPGMERHEKFAGVLVLSEFHKRYVRNFFNIPNEKLIVTANGIDPKRFVGLYKTKEFGKVIYSSSPDRGLENAIKVMKKVVERIPGAKLHVYYGFENMHKIGRGEEARRIEKLMIESPFVIYHGNLSQKELTKEFASACVWLYPTNFLETYCITAVEAMCAGVYPVVRKYGALPDTLRCGLIKDNSCETESQIQEYATDVETAFNYNLWEGVRFDVETYSWENIARQWIKMFDIGKVKIGAVK